MDYKYVITGELLDGGLCVKTCAMVPGGAALLTGEKLRERVLIVQRIFSEEADDDDDDDVLSGLNCFTQGVGRVSGMK